MIHLIHIPKTGGTALAIALGPRVHRPGHHLRLSDVPDDADAITILRDPVARFISAFNHIATHRLTRWPTADAMALDLEDPIDHDVYRPQIHWIDVDRPLLWVGRTETLDDDVRSLEGILGARIDLPDGHARNAGPPHRPLSLAAEDKVRAWYAADYDLLARLR